MQLSLIVFGLGLFTMALASTDFNGLPHPIHEPKFNGSLAGHDVQLNGTVQEMYAQMQALHPEFNPSHPGWAPGFDKKNLTSRAAVNKDGDHCCPVAGQDWTYALGSYIMDGIDYLNGIGRINFDARSCGRISCSYSAAIYVCNDNPYSIDPAATYLATYAWDLLNTCSEYPPQWYQITCGQEFDTDGYNVIVREDSC